MAQNRKFLFALVALTALAACTTTKTKYIPQPVFPSPPDVLMEPPEEFKIIEIEENVG